MISNRRGDDIPEMDEEHTGLGKFLASLLLKYGWLVVLVVIIIVLLQRPF